MQLRLVNHVLNGGTISKRLSLLNIFYFFIFVLFLVSSLSWARLFRLVVIVGGVIVVLCIYCACVLVVSVLFNEIKPVVSVQAAHRAPLSNYIHIRRSNVNSIVAVRRCCMLSCIRSYTYVVRMCAFERLTFSTFSYLYLYARPARFKRGLIARRACGI